VVHSGRGVSIYIYIVHHLTPRTVSLCNFAGLGKSWYDKVAIVIIPSPRISVGIPLHLVYIKVSQTLFF